MRRQRSSYSSDTIFEQENFYFFCVAEDRITEQDLDDYEREAEFVLRYVDIDEAIRVNKNYRSSDIFDTIMIKRDAMVLQIINDTLRNK